MAGKPPPAASKYEEDKASTYLVGKSGPDVHEDELARKRGRKTMLIAAGVLLALAVVGTAVGVGVSVSKRNDNKSSGKHKLVIGSNSTSSASQASVADLKYLPDPSSPEAQELMRNGSPEVKLMYQMAEDALLITPEKAVEFLQYFDSIANLTGRGVDMAYYEDQAYSLAHWFRAKGYTAVLDLLRKFARGETPDVLAVAQAVEQLYGVLKDKGDFRSWMGWPGDKADAALSDDTMTRRQADDNRMTNALINSLGPGSLDPVTDNKRKKNGKLLVNPYQQYTNIIDPNGWMNNPSIMGYPWFKPMLIPIVFHILMFKDYQGYLGPRNAYSQNNKPGEYLISIMNRAYKSTNIQFRLSEWRNDPKKFTYLNLGSVDAWQGCASQAEKCTCTLAAKHNKDPRKYINIWVSGSDAYPGLGDSTDIAYSTLIPSVMDTCKDRMGWGVSSVKSRHLWFLWDQVDPDYSNSEAAYNDGAATIIHEVGHQLGLMHTHQGDCSDQDQIADTPPNQVVQDASYYDTLTRLCIAAWRNPKKAITYDQVKSMNTCKSNQYIDNIMNYMSYTHAACYKLFTTEQTKRMQRIVTAYYNRFRPMPKKKKKAAKTGRRLAA